MRRQPAKHRSNKQIASRLPRKKRQRVRFQSVRSRNDGKVSEDLKRLAEDGAQQFVEVAGKIHRSSLLRRLIRLAGISLVGCVGLVLMMATAVELYVDDSDVKRWLVESIQHETGGKVALESVKFSVFNGITINKLSLYPPDPADSTGYARGGAILSAPLISIKKIRFQYQFFHVFLGRIDLNAAQAISPKLNLIKQDGVFNFEGISRYRQLRFEASQLVSDSQTTEVKSSQLGKSAVPVIARSYLFMPFALKLSNIGFDNLALYYHEEIDQLSFQNKLVLKGLSLRTDLSWFGFSSLLNLSLNSHNRSDLYFSFQKNLKARPIEAQMNLSNIVRLKDLQTLSLSLANQVSYLSLKQNVTLRGLTSSLESELFLDDSLQHIQLRKMAVSLLDAITYRLSGSLQLGELDQDKLRLNASQTFDIDLFGLGQVVKQIYPTTELFGAIKLERFVVDGMLDLNKLSSDNLELPFIQSNLSLIDVRAKLPKVGLELKPLNGNLAVGAGPSILGQGSQLDSVLALSLDGVSFESIVNENIHQLMIQNFALNLNSRMVYPKLSLPIFKLHAYAENVLAKANNVKQIDVPFEFEVDSHFHENLSKAGLSSRLELSEVFDSSLNILCKQRCSNVKFDFGAEFFSLQNLYQLLRPVAQQYVSLKDLPESLGGRASTHVGLRAHLGEFANKDLHQILNSAEVKFNSQTDIIDLIIKIPSRGIMISGFSNQLGLRGDLKRQLINLKQSFDSFHFGSPDEQSLARISDYRLETEFVSELIDSNFPDISNLGLSILNGMRNQLKINLRLGQMQVPQHFPKTVNNLSFQLAASQQRKRFVNIEKFALNIPDFGTKVLGSLQSSLSQNLNPRDVKLAFRTEIDHSEGKLLPSGARTKGSLVVDFEAFSKDLKKFNVDGKALFDHFHISVPNENNPDLMLLAIEDMHGQMPLQQEVDLSKTLKHLKDNQSLPNSASSDQSFEHVAQRYLKSTDDTITANANQMLMLDYSSVRPFFPEKRPISIQRLALDNLEFKKLEFDIELKQNWFSVNQYVIEFLGGKMAGDLQFAFDPNPLILQTSLHLTHLDTRKLLSGFPNLRKKAKGWSFLSNPHLDGTLHLRYDLRTNDLGGSIDITSIGKEQLKMILYYIDPKQENPTIAQLRSALNFGEVSEVSVPIKNGFIGLDVDLRLLKAPIPTPSLRGFPIAQLVENFKTDAFSEFDRKFEPSSSSDNQQQGGKGQDDDLQRGKDKGPEISYDDLVH